LFDYLKNRMNAIAPNLSVMVGETVGARLIAHAGSLLSLAKQPRQYSTDSRCGEGAVPRAENRARHSQVRIDLSRRLVGQAGPKNKGKMARLVAAKTALSIRMDALGETEDASIGLESRERVEKRLRAMESGKTNALSGTPKGKDKA